MHPMEQPTHAHVTGAFSGFMATRFVSGWRIPALGVLLLVMCLAPMDLGEAAETGKQIFKSTCAPCHTIGKGKLVGPDLAGVTSRREPDWLRRQIKEPDRLIAEKDPIALQLLREADDVPMSPLDLNDAQVTAVIAFLKSVEKQAEVEIGFPSQYVPTVLIAIVVLFGLTLIALRAGNKKVDVR